MVGISFVEEVFAGNCSNPQYQIAYDRAKRLWQGEETYGRVIAMVILVGTMFLGVLVYSIYRIITFLFNGINKDKKCSLVESFKHHYQDEEDAKTNILRVYRMKQLVKGLLAFGKVGSILILLLTTIVYEAQYNRVTAAKTAFGSVGLEFFRRCVVVIVAAISGSLSVLGILFSRFGLDGVKKFWHTPVTVAIILGLFESTTETSGFNRYTDKVNIEAGFGHLAVLDGTSDMDTLSKYAFAMFEMNNDPFIRSVIVSLCVVLICGVFVFVASLIIGAGFAWRHAAHCSVNNYKILWGTGILPFLVEIFAFAIVLPSFPFFVRSWIESDTVPSGADCLIGTTMAFIGVGLHLTMQYTGFLLPKLPKRENDPL